MFNGTGKIIKTDHIDAVIYTDASGVGFGGFVEEPFDYFFGAWEKTESPHCSHVEFGPVLDDIHKSIGQKELWPILISCKRLGKVLKGKNVVVYTDNQSVRSMINSGRSKDIHAMSMLREIFWICFIYNFELSAKYVKGIDNVKADFLSRVYYFSTDFLLSNRLFLSFFSCCRDTLFARCPDQRNRSPSTIGVCREHV